MSVIEIFGFPPSTYTQAARLALAEKGVEHTLSRVDFGRPEHLAVHPFAKIPAMRRGNLTLFESSAIATYADLEFEGPSLTPSDPVAAALMQQWVTAGVDYLYPAFVKPGLSKEPASEDDKLLRDRAGKAMDQALSKSDYLAGDMLSIADLEIVPMVNYFSRFDDGVEFLSQHPPVAAWLERMRARPSFKAVIPE